jgi:acetyl esterase/lipase
MPEHSWDATLHRLRAAPATAPATRPSLRELRDSFAPAGTRHPVPDDVEITPVHTAHVTGQWFRCAGADTTRTVLYLHSGGYALGSPTTHGELIARIARASGMGVFALDYRLAPEHPFPAALDDTRAAWTWLRTSHDLDAHSIAVVADPGGADPLLRCAPPVSAHSIDKPFRRGTAVSGACSRRFSAAAVPPPGGAAGASSRTVR